MNKSRNKNDDDLLTGAFNVMISYINKKMQNSLPVKVTKVSADRKFVNVRPQILVVDSEGNTIIRAEIKGIPVETPGAGNFLMTFNIEVGDLGWIHASDRDISLFVQSYDQSKPNTKRMHEFSDAKFIPDIMTNFTIDEEDSDSVIIQNRDASVKISFNQDRIKLKAPDIFIETVNSVDVMCGGNLIAAVDGDIDFSCSGQFLVVADSGADINGATISASGAIESPVSLTAPSAIIDGKELKDHDHPAGTPPANTGTNN